MPEEVYVRFESDGTEELTISGDPGHRVTARIWDSGRAIIKVMDERRRPIRAVLLRRAYIIDRKITYDDD